MRRALPIAIAIFLAGVLSYAVSRLDHARSVPPPTTVATTAPAALDALAQLDHDIAFYRARGEADPHDWIDWEYAAHGYMARARLSGDYADWRHAEDALDRSFSAVPNFGPYLTRATFNSAMHRLDRADADLDRAERSALITISDYDAILAMRADVRFYGGRYAEALEIYDGQIARTRRSVDALVMLAQLDWHTGHFEEATALLDEAIADPRIGSDRDAAMRAWVLMTRAMMERDRGRLDDALTVIETAHALSPNDAHIDEVGAEIHEARGDDDEALAAFRAIAAQTSSPQALDGVARILMRRGDTLSARELTLLARQSYDAQIAYYPEAAYGHAIDHWLRLEPGDVDRMIEIAEGNATARPYGETKVKLAMAYLLAGRTADARRVIDEVLTTEWRTADLYGVDAITREREGQDASAPREAAETMAPGALERLAWLSAGP